MINDPVSRSERVLLIVNSLSEHGDRRFRWLYQFTETAGVGIARRFLGKHYRFIHVLKDRNASRSKFLSSLDQIFRDIRVNTLDLFIQLHGEPGRIRFYDQWISSNHLGREITRISSTGCLRLVYNLSCYGDSHSAAFLRSGFNASVGAFKVNASAATEYPRFCRLWPKTGIYSRSKLVLSDVVRRSDSPFSRNTQDRIVRRYFRDVDSIKRIRGNSNLTINT
ncbi:MAG: hypothetical protein SCJ97_04760 [Bacillota bacterium]|nr:hypothetical protein [Bacillota bacterium]